MERFSNPGVRDTVARNCAFTSDRIPTFLLPVVRDQLAAGRDITRCATVVASWARYADGVDEQGNRIEVVDKLKDQLTAAARQRRTEPDAFIRIRSVFGDLADNEQFTAAYLTALKSLHENGARATVEQINTHGGRQTPASERSSRRLL